MVMKHNLLFLFEHLETYTDIQFNFHLDNRFNQTQN